MIDWRHTTTDRLLLDQPELADLDDLHRIHGDPINWTHFPQGRHLDLERTRQTIEQSDVQWEEGLGYWCVRTSPNGPVVGLAGCMRQADAPWWNLYYRLDSAFHGRGYAAEVARHAIAAAVEVAPDRPVLAYLLEHNAASRRTAERLGLRLIWRGPDAGNDDTSAIRLVYLDREPGEALWAALAQLGMTGDAIT